MDYTYYVIFKKYKGIYTRNFQGNNSFIITTLSRTNEGIMFIPMGIYQGDENKVLLWTQGFIKPNSQEITQRLTEESRFYQILDKIPSKSNEIVNQGQTNISVEDWTSPLKFNITLLDFGNYFKSLEIKMMLFRQLEDQSMIFISDMKFKPQLDDIEEPEVKMTAYKTKALFHALMK